METRHRDMIENAVLLLSSPTPGEQTDNVLSKKLERPSRGTREFTPHHSHEVLLETSACVTYARNTTVV